MSAGNIRMYRNAKTTFFSMCRVLDARSSMSLSLTGAA